MKINQLDVACLQPFYDRNELLTHFSKAILKDRYLLPNEDFQDLFLRVAKTYADFGDNAHAERLYDYISKMWFMPSTPILSNGGTERGLPISCFINEMEDSLDSISKVFFENIWLAAKGGGIGTYMGNVRSIGEPIMRAGTSSGIIPFIKMLDSQTLAISQGSLRRGSTAVYLNVEHPEIEEFIEIRKQTGGDYNRRSLNIHHAVCITDKFMHAVKNGHKWDLRSPVDGRVLKTVIARELWIKILVTRIETGEPYMLFIDTVNRLRPEIQKKLGIEVHTSNLCSEITLPTGKDHIGNMRTAVCCLSSLNLEYFDEWSQNEQFIEDIMRFLDNVLSSFIKHAPSEMKQAKYSALRERSVGLGVMGLHSYLQSKRIPFESAMAKVYNLKIFKHINEKTTLASTKLADERGACPDAAEAGINLRFSNTSTIAPTASISVICGNTSPGIEPYAANVFTQKTLTGSFVVKNKHLEKLFQEKGIKGNEVWSSIAANSGSVQHLDFLDDHEKLVFKTAIEMDQNWLVSHAADRTPYITQSQSLNLFFPANVSKTVLHAVHLNAYEQGVKSLYYLRSQSLQRADKAVFFDRGSMNSTNPAGHAPSTTTAGSETQKNIAADISTNISGQSTTIKVTQASLGLSDVIEDKRIPADKPPEARAPEARVNIANAALKQSNISGGKNPVLPLESEDELAKIVAGYMLKDDDDDCLACQ